uniref:Uncharacterized protein n=1 Tax=Tanacetum cinerariifolium TaxID=118510 RepID=A0A699GTV3_TANCI|nr:hypothetical protein [Tanacetum cinerariifolium]GEW76820.1 hypothetical protein [Tanacetum cinerariifolium]
MAWRHHDSDINDPAPKDGFSMQDVEALTEKVIDLRLVPSGLLFQGGLATTWDYLGFRLIFKDTEGNGNVLVKTSPRRQITKEGSKWKILKSLPPGREKQGPRLRKGRERSKPLRTLNPHQPSSALAATAESRENRSPPASTRDSANRSVQNYSDDHHDEETDDLNLGSFGGQSRRALTLVNIEVLTLRKASHPERRPFMCQGSPFIVDVMWTTPYGAESSWIGESQQRAISSEYGSDLRIKELEDALAQKDSDLVYAERINAGQAQENERLVSQVGKVEMENFYCIRKLLPTVDLLELMGKMEGFDIHADTRMRVEYEKLFERRYPYVEKISHGFRHSISDLLKVYPDSPPRKQVLTHKPSSKKAPAISALLGSSLLLHLWFAYV